MVTVNWKQKSWFLGGCYTANNMKKAMWFLVYTGVKQRWKKLKTNFDFSFTK